MQAITTQLLGAHLGVDRAMYAEVAGERGAEIGAIRGQFVRPTAPDRPAPAPFPDRFTYESFGTDVMARRYSGEGFAVADVNADPRFDTTERAAWAAVGVQAAIVAPLVKGGRLVAELGVQSETPRLWTEAEISLVREVGERTWAAAERARAEAALRVSEARLQSAISISTVGVLFWGPDFRLSQVNDAFLRLTGFARDEVIGKSWQELTPPEFYPVSEVALQELREHGESTPHEKQYLRKDGLRWWGLFAPRRLSDTEIVEFVIDISEQRRGVERQRLLLAELQHRVRNILTVVRSVARRTIEAGDNLEDVADHLDGRLASLARTQTMLTRAAGAGVDLEMLIREELLAQNTDDDVVDLSGPDIELAPKAAEVLTLAIHEWATNATKYGAFAQAGASLEVRWWLERGERETNRLRLVWLERGVRMIAANPRRAGFGSELIQQRVPYELRGTGRVELLPGGVRAEISFPLVHGASILATHAPGDPSRIGDDL
ncbi:PAS domain S-box protein [Phenylobacterium sp. J426]|uniref:HWE histidine kinase domain-containing protein n=1 Tax=Phenylobacterium sp. J426 TaxID=2898439 RepID=UPI002151FBA3|nr:HWE histidine kinase domain-containing protein [Phenylobacterium sp. J426]MCR5876902.1 PAS domain S-box protein [Phenylobacterium sp. J426]